jgi:ribonucleoside-diphosphate reductase alpha chain
MQAAFQRYTENSVSKTINFPHHATVADVAEAYTLAYTTGCKGITVYRDGSKEGQVLSIGETAKHALSEAEGLAHRTPRQRPRATRGVTERVRTGHGNMYVTINYDEAGKPFEVFGTLGKAGGCDSAQLEAISRLVSLALRSGIAPQEVIGQLRGITCCPAWDSGTLVRSSPDAVALALEHQLAEVAGPSTEGLAAPAAQAVQLKLSTHPAQPGLSPDAIGVEGLNSNGSHKGLYHGRRCPDCNTPVIYQEGCLMCVSCGWNKCE